MGQLGSTQGHKPICPKPPGGLPSVPLAFSGTYAELLDGRARAFTLPELHYAIWSVHEETSSATERRHFP